MPTELQTHPSTTPDSRRILVAGDICLDVAGIPVPAASDAHDKKDNWRQTGEVRTHYMPGGALQLARFVQAAVDTIDPRFAVRPPRPCRPKAITCNGKQNEAMTIEEFLEVAERLTRSEVVHSLLHLEFFKGTSDSKKPDAIRVEATHGFSGPREADPTMNILPPVDEEGIAEVIVLDDTGNRFRRSPEQWPAAVGKPASSGSPIFVYKLHRPLPDGENTNPLWDAIKASHLDHCLVVLSVDDLREHDAPISRGLSWEQTALDLVWQLLNEAPFASLRDCPHLVVRFGLDGALYWQCIKDQNETKYRAWLVYDPDGIEGTGAHSFAGKMVGYASVFTAAIAAHLAKAGPVACFALRKDENNPVESPSEAIEMGIKAGLLACRRLLRFGFVKKGGDPQYPGEDLFKPGNEKEDPAFSCQPVPIIPGAATPDRGYWRLLESIFSGKTALLHRAVTMTATGAKPATDDDRDADVLLKQVPKAVFAKALRAIDRREIENYRALYSLLKDYVEKPSAPRPLSVAVFGPPGAGKSFGVKMVAKALGQVGGQRPIDPITFNLSQYQKAEELADAFHLVRDRVLAGKIPLVFFDEFDTSLGGQALGWLRYFLAPMQDGEFLDAGVPHPIGQAIFVFAGGTCGSYAEFAQPFTNGCSSDKAGQEREAFKKAKGPDFLSRLRATLDIPGLDLQPKFDPFGPVEAFPCEAAILLRRAGIFAFQLAEKAPGLCDSAKVLRVGDPVLRALLHLPTFVHGNRSFEAMLDMSHFHGAHKFTPSLLPASGHTGIHANATHLAQLLATDYPFPPEERKRIAQAIHEHYVEQRKAKGEYKKDKPSHQEWNHLSQRFKDSNCEQADAIALKLRSVGLWFRKKDARAKQQADDAFLDEKTIEHLAYLEHDRWVVNQRRAGFIYAPESDHPEPFTHHCILKWEDHRLSQAEKDKDIDAVRAIPRYLAAAGYEIIRTDPIKCDGHTPQNN